MSQIQKVAENPAVIDSSQIFTIPDLVPGTNIQVFLVAAGVDPISILQEKDGRGRICGGYVQTGTDSLTGTMALLFS